jgi:hypothetical protein
LSAILFIAFAYGKAKAIQMSAVMTVLAAEISPPAFPALSATALINWAGLTGLAT